MTEQEFLADLQTKVFVVGAPALIGSNGVAQEKTVQIVELGQRNTVRGPRNFGYVVLNPGVVAGPQTYSEDVLDVDGVTVLHSAGDPILDESGTQVVINPLFAENAYATSAIDLPVGDALNAVAYLEAQKAAGTWNAYEYEQGRSDLGFFFAKVWVSNPDGTESEKRVRVTYDAAGNPSHVEVV